MIAGGRVYRKERRRSKRTGWTWLKMRTRTRSGVGRRGYVRTVDGTMEGGFGGRRVKQTFVELMMMCGL